MATEGGAGCGVEATDSVGGGACDAGAFGAGSTCGAGTEPARSSGAGAASDGGKAAAGGADGIAVALTGAAGCTRAVTAARRRFHSAGKSIIPGERYIDAAKAAAATRHPSTRTGRHH